MLGMIGETLDPGTEEICGVRIVDKSRGQENISTRIMVQKRSEGSTWGSRQPNQGKLEECLKTW